MSDYQPSDQVSLDKSQDSPKPGKSGSGRVFAIAALVVVAIALIAFFLVGRSADREARGTFETLMNALAGPGNWTSEKISYSLTSKAMIASNVTVDLKSFDPSLDQPLKIASVEIKNGLSRAELQALLALPDWRTQNEKSLADSVKLTGVSIDNQDEASVVTLSAKELLFEGLSLSAAGSENAPGPLGFVKSGAVKRLLSSSLSLSVNGADTSTLSISLEKVDSHGLSYLSDLSDLASFYQLATMLSIESQIFSNLSVNFRDRTGKNTLKAAMAEQTRGPAGDLRYDSVVSKGMSLDFALILEDDSDTVTNFASSIEEATFTDVDVKPLLEKIFRSIELTGDASPDAFESAMERFTTLADLFTLSYSLGTAEAKNVKMSLDSSVLLSVDSCAYTGPSIAGVIPPKQSWSFSGLRISLPQTEPDIAYLKKIFAFGRDFEQTEFVLNNLVSTAYDPATGSLVYTGRPAVEGDNLAVINLDIGFANLTPDLVEAMNSIPMVEAENVLFLPGFADFGLSKLRLEITDDALIDKIIGYAAKKNGQNKEVMRTTVAVTAPILLGLAENRVGNTAEIGQLVSEFIVDPNLLVIDLSPTEPLSMTSILRSQTQSELLNSLNATITVNDNSPLLIEFIEPPALPPAEGEDSIEEGPAGDGDLGGQEGLGEPDGGTGVDEGPAGGPDGGGQDGLGDDYDPFENMEIIEDLTDMG
ncbi:MAG: hypothetical protein LBE49_01910 [Deltaproteobacteria bacterium]|jgi:hypothetical protein|nr:hypothetical protein [Deltaproteobacteria bacterium]